MSVQRKIKFWQEKLLDLSMRNRLLNFRPTKVTTIRLIDELPPEIFKLLAVDRIKMRFLPLKEETENDEEVITSSNFSKGFTPSTPTDLQERYVDKYLQTNLSRASLDKNLFRIFSKASSAMEERGYNVLFLALGFIEWYEAPQSDIKRKSPLFLLPVELERTSVRIPFKLSYNGEQLIFNPALALKFKRDFGIDLDFEIPEDSELIDLRVYFERIYEIIFRIDRWKVTNDIYLGLANSSSSAVDNLGTWIGDNNFHNIKNSAGTRVYGSIYATANYQPLTLARTDSIVEGKYKDETLSMSESGSPSYRHIKLSVCDGGHSYIDMMYIRKYTSPEPTVSIYAEQNNLDLSFRKPITIDNTANANTLYDYQVLVTVDTDALSGHMETDASDLRFTSSSRWSDHNWDISYPYWIESGLGTSTTKIWVKVDNIPASDSKTIYMYYGNGSATSVESGLHTFPFFDDFSSANATKWYAQAGELTVSGGEAVVNNDNLNGNRAFGEGYAFEFRIKGAAGADGAGSQCNTQRTGSPDTNDRLCYLANMGNKECHTTCNDGTCTYDEISGAFPTNYVIITNAYVSTSASKLYKNRILVNTKTTNIPTESLYPNMRSWSGSTVYFDYYFVRKFTDPEPLVGSPGTEEELTPPTVSTEAATSVTGHSATLNGNLSNLGGADSCLVWFVWGLTTSYTATTDTQVIYSTGGFSTNISGLETNTTYHFKAVAENIVGTSTGGDLSFTTLSPTEITVDWNNGNIQSIILEGDAEFTFINGQAGGIYKLIVKQGAGAPYFAVWPASVMWEGVSSPTLSEETGDIDIFTFIFDGTDYLGTYNLNFDR